MQGAVSAAATLACLVFAQFDRPRQARHATVYIRDQATEETREGEGRWLVGLLLGKVHMYCVSAEEKNLVQKVVSYPIHSSVSVVRVPSETSEREAQIRSRPRRKPWPQWGTKQLEACVDKRSSTQAAAGRRVGTVCKCLERSLALSCSPRVN